MEFDCLPFMGLMNLGVSYRMMFLSGSMRGMAKCLFGYQWYHILGRLP